PDTGADRGAYQRRQRERKGKNTLLLRREQLSIDDFGNDANGGIRYVDRSSDGAWLDHRSYKGFADYYSQLLRHHQRLLHRHAQVLRSVRQRDEGPRRSRQRHNVGIRCELCLHAADELHHACSRFDWNLWIKYGIHKLDRV